MKKQAEQTTQVVVREPLKRLLGYLTVREAAQVIGVSERSVYGYVESGKLSGMRLGNLMVVLEEEVKRFERKAPGRARVRPPRWHQPPKKNQEYLTIIKVRLRLGQIEALERKIEQMRIEKRHLLPGTAARYLGYDHDDPTLVVLMLVWREAVMPSPGEREAALLALKRDLEEVLDWSTATETEGLVLLHA